VGLLITVLREASASRSACATFIRRQRLTVPARNGCRCRSHAASLSRCGVQRGDHEVTRVANQVDGRELVPAVGGHDV
jgi:hypothetical protein